MIRSGGQRGRRWADPGYTAASRGITRPRPGACTSQPRGLAGLTQPGRGGAHVLSRPRPSGYAVLDTLRWPDTVERGDDQAFESQGRVLVVLPYLSPAICKAESSALVQGPQRRRPLSRQGPYASIALRYHSARTRAKRSPSSRCGEIDHQSRERAPFRRDPGASDASPRWFYPESRDSPRTHLACRASRASPSQSPRAGSSLE